MTVDLHKVFHTQCICICMCVTSI